MEDHRYSRRSTMVQPQIIVIKEEPIWKVNRNKNSFEDILIVSNEEPEVFLFSNEEPELELTVPEQHVELLEDPLLLSETEDSGYSKSSNEQLTNSEYSVKQCSNDHNHLANIHLADDNSVDFKIEEIFNPNNKEIDYEDEGVEEQDDEELEIKCINEGKNIDEEYKSFLDNNKGKFNLENKEEISSVIPDSTAAKKYRLRTCRSSLKRYSPIDFSIEQPKKRIKSKLPKFQNKKKSTRDNFPKKIIINRQIKLNYYPKINENLYEVDCLNVLIKRNVHNARERNRRSITADLFQKLYCTLPAAYKTSDKTSKVIILNTAKECIEHLHRREKYLLQVFERLEEKNATLRLQLFYLQNG